MRVVFAQINSRGLERIMSVALNSLGFVQLGVLVNPLL